MSGEWRKVCAATECVEWRPLGLVWELRAHTDPNRTVLWTTSEIAQLAQAYAAGEFGSPEIQVSPGAFMEWEGS